MTTYLGTDMNPRFPHHLRVLRAQFDEMGVPMTDDNGDPMYELVHESSFGYRTQTLNTSASGEVIVADHKIALPRTLVTILTGDILEVTDYTRSYRAYVVKAITYNLGTNLWIEEAKN